MLSDVIIFFVGLMLKLTYDDRHVKFISVGQPARIQRFVHDVCSLSVHLVPTFRLLQNSMQVVAMIWSTLNHSWVCILTDQAEKTPLRTSQLGLSNSNHCHSYLYSIQMEVMQS